MPHGDQNPERDTDIVRRCIKGEKMSELAKEYGVSYSTVRRVVRKGMHRMRWAIIKDHEGDPNYNSGYYHDIPNLVEMPEQALELYERGLELSDKHRAGQREERLQRNAAKAAQKLVRARARLLEAQASLEKAEREATQP
jgi:lambda repressor-like predicted transcriptional regulator